MEYEQSVTSSGCLTNTNTHHECEVETGSAQTQACSGGGAFLCQLSCCQDFNAVTIHFSAVCDVTSAPSDRRRVLCASDVCDCAAPVCNPLRGEAEITERLAPLLA